MDLIIKRKIIDEIRANVDVFKPAGPIRYRIRCPFCGDSQTHPQDAHLYIKCSDDPNEPLLYNCFLANCGVKGKIDKAFMDRLGIKSEFEQDLKDQRYNKLNVIKSSNVDELSGVPNMDSPQVRYIESRLGPGFTYDDYTKFRIVWDMEEIRKYITSERLLNTLPTNLNRVTFLSDNKSMLVSRSFIEDSEESQWRKIPMFETESKTYYMIQTTLDLFTSEIITVNIAEGIFDILSAYKNFNDGPNSVYIAALGPDYIGALEYMAFKGFIGKNINVNIYIDSNIHPGILLRRLKKRRWLFNSIRVFKNIKYKDIGVNIEKIKLMEVIK